MHRRTTFALTLLLLTALPCLTQAAGPGHGAACGEFAAGANACNASGCFVCNGTSWIDQPLYFGTSSATCDASHAGLHRYNSTSRLPEYCNGTAWTTLTLTQPNTSPSTPSGSGFFVMSHSTWDGGMVGLSGADAKCLTELSTTYTNWRGYSDANARGMLTATKVHAFLCDMSSCNSLLPSTTYYLGYANDSKVGGASFTTDSNGFGPGDAISWAAANYFSGSYTYWSGRDTDPGTGITPTLWTNRTLGNNYYNCDGWTNTDPAQSGTTGYSSYNNQYRWNLNFSPCSVQKRLICYVNPVCSAVDSFSFIDLSGQVPTTQISSNIIQITGGSCAGVGVSISGTAAPQYRICSDSGCSNVVTNWTSSATTMARGHYIQLRATSSSSANTAASTTLTIEAQSTTWSVTTEDYKLIFVTSTTSSGNLKGAAADGLAGADSSCNTRASGASLPGTYKAWLGTTSGNDPAHRFTQSSAPYRLPIAALTKVANNWAGLISGTLLNAINRSESGTSISNTNNVWSNADSAGTAVGANNCTSWTSNSSGVSGAVGSSNATSTGWANNSTIACNGSKRLYCVQQ